MTGYPSSSGLQAEPHPRVAGKALEVGDPVQDDRHPAIVGVESMRPLRSCCKSVIERVRARGGNVGGDDRTAREGDLDPD